MNTNTKELKDIITDPVEFLEKLFYMLEDIGLDVEKYPLDHICYRVETMDEYREKKIALESFGTLLIESMVNGRLISTFKLLNLLVLKIEKSI